MKVRPAYAFKSQSSLVFEFSKAQDRGELWMQIDTGSVSEQGSVIHSGELYHLLSDTQTSAVVDISLIDYHTSDDLYYVIEGYLGILFEMMGLKNVYRQELIIEREGLKIFPSTREAQAINKKKTVAFVFSQNLREVWRQPSTIVDAIARLGGILVIINIGFLISFLNEQCFRCKLRRAVAERNLAADLAHESTSSSLALNGSVPKAPNVG